MMEEEEAAGANGFVVPSQRERALLPLLLLLLPLFLLLR